MAVTVTAKMLHLAMSTHPTRINLAGGSRTVRFSAEYPSALFEFAFHLARMLGMDNIDATQVIHAELVDRVTIDDDRGDAIGTFPALSVEG